MGKILNKIKEFFRNIIFKNKVKQLEMPKKNDMIENKSSIDVNRSSIDSNKQGLNQETIEQSISTGYNYLSERDRIFEIYTKVKNDTIDFSTVAREDLLKIRRLLLEESKIQDERLEKDIQKLEMYG